MAKADFTYEVRKLPMDPVGIEDYPTWAKLVAALALFGFSVLVATVVVTFTGDNTWALLFLVTAALAAVAGVLAFRAYRAPYESQGARKP